MGDRLLGPKLSKWMVQPNEYNVGTLRIDAVGGLTLAGNNVQATARFNWSVDLNDLGSAFYGHGSGVSGAGGVARFSKKPDGSWVLQSYSF
jgi:hypothetical protein